MKCKTDCKSFYKIVKWKKLAQGNMGIFEAEAIAITMGRKENV